LTDFTAIDYNYGFVIFAKKPAHPDPPWPDPDAGAVRK
jgi:hypothetical protein